MIVPAPYWIAVQDSLVENGEQQRSSGILVPAHMDEGERPVRRGIVTCIGSKVHENVEISAGDVLHFFTGYKLGDLTMVPATFDNVLGWETDG